MKMSRTSRQEFINKARRSSGDLREVSRTMSCGYVPARICASRPNTGISQRHDRLMFAAGWRKGFKATLAGTWAEERRQARRNKGQPKDVAWADGYLEGRRFIPADKRSQP